MTVSGGDTFAERLAFVLGERTAYWLAKQTGLSTTFIDNLLKGKSKRPSTDTVARIAEALGVSIGDLMPRRPAPLVELGAEGVPDARLDELEQLWDDMTDSERNVLISTARSVWRMRHPLRQPQPQHNPSEA